MPVDHTDAVAQNRFTDILAAYLEADDAGWAPTREQLLARYPDQADELRAFFTNDLQADQWTEPLSAVTGVTKPPAPEPLDSMPTMAEGEGRPLPWIGGHLFGNYELLEEIARGSMGIVWKARQISLQRIVALKMILAGQLASPAEVQRFRTEAENAANLEHPNIVPFYEIGSHQGQHYFTMKLIQGSNLAQSLARDEWIVGDADTHRRAATLVAIVARAVHHAHQRGILHRDLKPANILLDAEGQPHVTDFGLAKRIESGTNLTQTGVIVGTPSYMPPEQARGRKDLTVAADVYSLGAILYELLAGRPPFRADTPLETVLQVVERDACSPRSYDPNLHRDLEMMCLKCLDKVTTNRYASAAALANDLDRWLHGDPVTVRSMTGMEKVIHWVRRRPALAALISVCIVAAFALVGIVITFSFNSALQIEVDHANEYRRKAEDEAERASIQQRRAEEESQLANRESRNAQQEYQKARRYQYYTNIRLADRALQEGQESLALELLTELIPKQRGEHDLRDFEWYYLRYSGKPSLVKTLLPQSDDLVFGLGDEGFICGSADGLVTTYPPPKPHNLLPALIAPEPRLDIAARFLTATSRYFLQDRPNRNQQILAVSINHETRRSFAKDGTIRSWDANGRESTSRVNIARPILLSRFSPDGQRLVCSYKNGSGDSYICLFDAGLGRELLTVPTAVSPASMAVSPDGTQLAYGLFNGTVKVVDTHSGQVKVELICATRPISAIAFNSSGDRLATTSGIGCGIWDLARGKEISWQIGHAYSILSMAFSPDDKRLATASWDRTVRIWDSATGDETLTLRGHSGPVISVAFSHDGQRLASGSRDGTVGIWDATPRLTDAAPNLIGD
jgi:tRNA A-37 threonylcarbamoyl transferase component Bud32